MLTTAPESRKTKERNEVQGKKEIDYISVLERSVATPCTPLTCFRVPYLEQYVYCAYGALGGAIFVQHLQVDSKQNFQESEQDMFEHQLQTIAVVDIPPRLEGQISLVKFGGGQGYLLLAAVNELILIYSLEPYFSAILQNEAVSKGVGCKLMHIFDIGSPVLACEWTQSVDGILVSCTDGSINCLKLQLSAGKFSATSSTVQLVPFWKNVTEISSDLISAGDRQRTSTVKER
eukprot:TRINITY_DN11687_c0_g1_i2.p1 TRINITY_DN11687_c0_g1~~TRINITY_DN11687_c0_g1_i2.p1  ORF type:complete len:233 (+),score=17.15 TRINITY_DN11687_c0_g1_i2:278-976(+)